MAYDNSNSGVLFKNDKKGDNPKAPEYNGSWEGANGKKWALAAWVKESKDGKKFFSLKASEFRAASDTHLQQQSQQNNQSADDLGLPF